MNDIAKDHHAQRAWAQVIARLRREIVQRQVHASDVVVLVPFAQLMQEARKAWALTGDGSHFIPRFETTENWSHSLGGFQHADDDIQMDAARDVLTAASLLERAGLGTHQALLAPRVMEAGWSLVPVAAAVPPQERAAWGSRLGNSIATGMDTPVLAMEAAVARVALAWAASSSYASDLLFDAQPSLLVVLEGFQTEPLASALLRLWGERTLVVSLVQPQEMSEAASVNERSGLALHVMGDAEDEAQAAAACVLAHLAWGRSPVALVAVDRVLTRRVRAMLDGRGLAVRDETGWKLSTTRAAATLMSLLRACAWDTSTDEVLDWLKNAPGFAKAEVIRLEVAVRRSGHRDWRSVAGTGELAQLVQQVNAVRETLQRARPLSAWLRDVRVALQNAGQWSDLLIDNAGQSVVRVLRLLDGDGAGTEGEFVAFTSRQTATGFVAWVSQTLEAESYLPTHPERAQVIILPMSQLLGRALPAVVLPGCDEVRLPVSPEPSGPWTPAQRELLGLPSRDQMTHAMRQSWQDARRSPFVNLLWRQSEGGERVMPSGFVQELMLGSDAAPSADPRVNRVLTAQPCGMPAPRGDALPLTRLSASAYEDLRRCPYRFFALRQLRLQESEELDTGLSKRDFGNWIHTLLKYFHEALKVAPTPALPARLIMINAAAEHATAELALSESEFLPFAAAWPRVRAGYLEWLDRHEAQGNTFEVGEVWREMPLGPVTLIGKLDRIDRMDSASATGPQASGSAMVIDYKTENTNITRERIKDPAEDTQLAFYAALLHDDTLAAAYVNIGEREISRTWEQTDIVVLRDQLIESIVDDMTRIAQGALLPALGEGKACEFCAARGLCRKDFWTKL